jgi:hypothetical protein
MRFYVGAIYPEGSQIPVVSNKGYIYFKETTKKSDGLVFYLHDGFVFAYMEKYRK